MILNIRGALGTQILETLVGLSRAEVKGEIIDEIHINCGGDVVDTARVDYITKLFDLPIPVSITNGTLKQRAWSRENIELLASNCPVHMLRPKKSDNAIRSLYKRLMIKKPHVFHVRGKDRQVVSNWQYEMTFNQILMETLKDTNSFPEFRIVGDDPRLISLLTAGYHDANIVNASSDPISDWMQCYHANVLYSSFTSFTLSAALFHPEKPYRIIDQSKSTGPHSVSDEYFQSIQYLMDNYFKDASWI
jgi:hypothetical protein